MGICLLSNLIWLPLTVRVIQNVIRYGYGANETKIGLAFPYLWAIHFFYFLLLSLPLGFSSFGILNKGKPLYFSIPVWILSVLYLAQFVIQCVILY